jgi:hypothetical protein
MPYIIPRDRWYDMIVLNVDVPTEGKIDDLKYGVFEELERVFDKFLKYYLKMLLGKTFSHQKLRMAVWTKLVMIMELQ